MSTKSRIKAGVKIKIVEYDVGERTTFSKILH